MGYEGAPSISSCNYTTPYIQVATHKQQVQVRAQAVTCTSSSTYSYYKHSYYRRPANLVSAKSCGSTRVLPSDIVEEDGEDGEDCEDGDNDDDDDGNSHTKAVFKHTML
jgi:hypothetical protein